MLPALRRSGEPFELTAGELSALTHVTSGTMTSRLDRLGGRGLVVAAPRPGRRPAGPGAADRAGRRRVDAAFAALLDSRTRPAGRPSTAPSSDAARRGAAHAAAGGRRRRTGRTGTASPQLRVTATSDRVDTDVGHAPVPSDRHASGGPRSARPATPRRADGRRWSRPSPRSAASCRSRRSGGSGTPPRCRASATGSACWPPPRSPTSLATRLPGAELRARRRAGREAAAGHRARPARRRVRRPLRPAPHDGHLRLRPLRAVPDASRSRTSSSTAPDAGLAAHRQLPHRVRQPVLDAGQGRVGAQPGAARPDRGGQPAQPDHHLRPHPGARRRPVLGAVADHQRPRPAPALLPGPAGQPGAVLQRRRRSCSARSSCSSSARSAGTAIGRAGDDQPGLLSLHARGRAVRPQLAS